MGVPPAPFQVYHEQNKNRGKRAFIFLHDIGFDRQMWLSALTEVGKHMRGIAYDLRGFGQNNCVNLDVATIDEHCDDLQVVMNKLGVKEAVLVGQNLGGHIALRAAEKFPEQVCGMVIGGFLPLVADGEEAAQLTETMQLLVNKGAKGGERFAKELSKSLIIDHEGSRKLIDHVKSHGAGALVAGLRALLTRTNHRGILESFQHPLLFTCGGAGEEGEYREYLTISVGINNARCVRIPESRLLPQLENPEAYNRALLRFAELFEDTGKKK